MASNTINLSTYRAKLLSNTYGANNSPVYINAGVPTILTTVGSTTLPVWSDAGVLKGITNYEGNAATASKWQTARALTIGGTAHDVDGSAAVSWTKDEILGSSTSAYFLRGDKAWSNTLVGDLYINSSTDVGKDQNGALIIGNKGGTNIGIDDNEIMARNNSAVSTLYINNEGGAIQMGSGGLNVASTIHSTAGLLKSTLNSNTVTIGSQNTSFCHIYNSANIPFIFNNTVETTSGTLGTTTYRWGTIYGKGTPGLDITVAAATWSYVRLHNGSNYWDIATKSDHSSGALELRPAGGDLAYYFNTGDMPEGAANLSAAANQHSIKFYRNGFAIPYQMDNANDGGIFRVRGTSESTCICEIGTWDDSGSGETIQFNYYPTTSQITPTYSIAVPKKTGTIALTSDLTWANITSKPETATRWPAWSEVTGKPTTFAPSSHSHTSLACIGSTSGETGRTAARGGVYSYNWYSGGPSSYLSVIGFGMGTGGHAEIAVNWTGNNGIWIRSLRDTTDNWWAWKRIPMADGTGASGTWGISITGSAGSVAWANTGHPSTFPPSSHTHDISQITWAGGSNLVCSGTNTEWSIEMASNATGSYWHVWSGVKGATVLSCYNSTRYVYIPVHLAVGGYDNTSYGLSASSIAVNGSILSPAYYISGAAGSNNCIQVGSGDANGNGGANWVLRSWYGIGIMSGCTSINNGVITAGVDARYGYIYSGRTYNAVWNDFAEFRESEVTEPGRVLISNGQGQMVLCDKRLVAGAKVISDTYGCSVGQSNTANTPLGVAGRVLVYTYQDRNNYKVGDAVCAAPNGTVDIMTREEIKEYPDRIIGIVDEIPTYKKWEQYRTCQNEDGESIQNKVSNTEVKGRIWIYVR